ncbi:MAG: hypothetical protein GX028_04365 [Clostridiaceae bacterium]|nr:hypothetical protein [Clostridiaceae bacterium]
MDQPKQRNYVVISVLFIYAAASILIFALFQNSVVAERFFDSLQLITSFGAGIFILTKGYKSEAFSPAIYIGYACIIWSFGQLFWFAYVLTGREGLPFPSVAELAFLGAYFFIISAVKDNAFMPRKRMVTAGVVSSLMVMATFSIILLTSQIKSFTGIYSLIFITTAAITLLFVISKQGMNLLLRSSIILLCITDFILVIQILFGFSSALFLSDLLYPLVFLLLMSDAWRKR